MTLTKAGQTTDPFAAGPRRAYQPDGEAESRRGDARFGHVDGVSITVGQISHALPGGLSLTAIATSRSDSAIRNADGRSDGEYQAVLHLLDRSGPAPIRPSPARTCL